MYPDSQKAWYSKSSQWLLLQASIKQCLRVTKNITTKFANSSLQDVAIFTYSPSSPFPAAQNHSHKFSLFSPPLTVIIQKPKIATEFLLQLCWAFIEPFSFLIYHLIVCWYHFLCSCTCTILWVEYQYQYMKSIYFWEFWFTGSYERISFLITPDFFFWILDIQSLHTNLHRLLNVRVWKQ